MTSDVAVSFTQTTLDTRALGDRFMKLGSEVSVGFRPTAKWIVSRSYSRLRFMLDSDLLNSGTHSSNEDTDSS
jgi:hypothetical protein